MVELTGRQRACLRYLCQQGTFVTTAELARHLGVSERTVGSDLEAFAREKGVALVRVPGSGVRLSCDATARSALADCIDQAGATVHERPERALRRCFAGIVTGREAARAERLAARSELPAALVDRAEALVGGIEGLQAVSFSDAEALALELAYALARGRRPRARRRAQPAPRGRVPRLHPLPLLGAGAQRVGAGVRAPAVRRLC